VNNNGYGHKKWSKKKGIGYMIKVKLEACKSAEKSSNEKAAKIALATQVSSLPCSFFS